jgi:hypothetical protein
MSEEKWVVNYIKTNKLGERKEIAERSSFCVMGEGFGENSQFSGIEIGLLQYNYLGEVKRVNLAGLSGVLARMGQSREKMKFHLTWAACLQILEECKKSGIITIIENRIIWREINHAIEMVTKNP